MDFRDNLTQNDFKIELEIIYSSPKTVIFEYGKTSTIPNGYGENDWLITYKDSLAVSFRHFKTNRNSNHKYNFQFYKLQENFYCEIKIEGANQLNQTFKFEPKELILNKKHFR